MPQEIKYGEENEACFITKLKFFLCKLLTHKFILGICTIPHIYVTLCSKYTILTNILKPPPLCTK